MSIARSTTTKGGTRYEVRLRGRDGKERSRTFKTHKEAARWERDQRHALDRGTWVDPRAGNTPFGAVAARWLTADPGKRPSTRARDESIVRHHLLPALGDTPLASVVPGDCERLVRAWVDSGLAPATVRLYAGIVRAIFSWALVNDLVARSPWRGIKLPRPDRTRPVHALTPAEVERLANAVGPGYAAMIWVGALAGLRWGEVVALRVGDLDLLRGTLTVARAVSRDAQGRSIVGAPKSAAGVRTVAIPPSLVELLAAHLYDRERTGADAEVLVFPALDGELLTYANWRNRIWLPALERAALPGVGFHDLRRTNATALVLAGVDPKTTQSRLGHTDPRLTLALDAQVVAQADRDAADRLGAAFLPGSTPDAQALAPRSRGKSAGKNDRSR